MTAQQIPRVFHLQVLGRTLEHLGSQMYKRRDSAIAELIANCWDAGATKVDVDLPTADYSKTDSAITITDDGVGMTEVQVEDDYLVLGRNRRAVGQSAPLGRPVMGRKGIGKLAGFGIAHEVQILTWRDGRATTLTMDLDELKLKPGVSKQLQVPGAVGPAPDDIDSPNGTRVTLRRLKQVTAPDVEALRYSLARKFTRTVRGKMTINVNGAEIAEPAIELGSTRVPPGDGWAKATISDGGTVEYYYGFSSSPIQPAEMRGFVVYANGKTAQAPPFYFHVEGTASGQHGTKYLVGAVEAAYLDAGTDDSDLISTDRQEIDWEDSKTGPLHAWGAELTRKALREWANRAEDRAEKWAYENKSLNARIDALDSSAKKQVKRAIRTLGKAEGAERARIVDLAGALVAAYEYRHFHDVVEEIDAAGEDPVSLATLLDHLRQWKVLESRAILEIIKGRQQIVDKFHSMVVNNAPETNPSGTAENLHDLIAAYPWLLNPEWQVLAEEKSITAQLREWGAQDLDEDAGRQRYDFLALEGPSQILIIEIKRPGHAVSVAEVQRLLQYKHRLEKGSSEPIRMVLTSGGTYEFNRDDYATVELLEWNHVYARAKNFYQHYRAVLEGEPQHADFHRKEVEVAQTREVLQYGAHRDRDERAAGVGPQDPPPWTTDAASESDLS